MVSSVDVIVGIACSIMKLFAPSPNSRAAATFYSINEDIAMQWHHRDRLVKGTIRAVMPANAGKRAVHRHCLIRSNAEACS